jgi:hypothetical protein
MLHDIAERHPDVVANTRKRELVDQAEATYRSDEAMRKDLEELGWDPARRAAAWEGRAVKGDRTVDHQPALDLDRLAGRQVAQQRLHPFAEFAAMRAQVEQERIQILARIHDEVAAQAVGRERQLLESVPGMRVADLDDVTAELTALVRTLGACRAAAGVRPREGAMREHVTPLDVFVAAAAYAAGRPYTLLTPVVQDRSMIVDAAGLHTDHAPTPRKATALPPAGIVLKGD